MGQRDNSPEKRNKGKQRRVVKASLDKNERRDRPKDSDRTTKAENRDREQREGGRDDNRRNRQPRNEGSQGSSFPWVAVIVILIVIAVAVYFLFLR